MKDPILFLRRVGFAEAVSFLILVFVAVPLKYFGGMPKATMVPGMIHGVLFVLFCWALLRASVIAGWPLGRPALYFLSALLPFGPFLLDRRARAWEQEYLQRSKAARG